MPAILKGYIDRVFPATLVGSDNGKVLAGRKAALIMTAERSTRALRTDRVLRATKVIHEDGVMGYCGFEVVGSICLTCVESGIGEPVAIARFATIRYFVHRTFPPASSSSPHS